MDFYVLKRFLRKIIKAVAFFVEKWYNNNVIVTIFHVSIPHNFDYVVCFRVFGEAAALEMHRITKNIIYKEAKNGKCHELASTNSWNGIVGAKTIQNNSEHTNNTLTTNQRTKLIWR